MKKEISIEAEEILFEFYLKWIWPIHRLFVKKYYSKRCKRCAIAEERSQLDNDGVCKLCHEYDTHKGDQKEKIDPKLFEEQESLLSSYEGKGKLKYDAVILFSGGKDSSYLLHRLKETHPNLRLLALTVDNSFMSSIAMENATSISKKLGIDHITLAPKKRVFENMFRFAITNLRGLGSMETVDMLDGDFLIDQGRNLAATMKIPLVVIGYSHEQVKIEHLEINNWYNNGKPRLKSAIYPLEEITLKEDLHYWWDESKYEKNDVPTVIFPFYAWDLSEEFIKSEVDRLGLIDYKRTSPLITNNKLIPLQGIVDIVHLGYSSWEPEFTQMVREGKADKKHWQYTFELLQYCARTGYLVKKSIEESLSWLGLTPKDVGITWRKVGGCNSRK